MMKLVLLLIFIFSFDLFAQECPEGMFQVQGHHRQAHYRSGSHVSATDVSTYCKNYRNDGPLKLGFNKKMPKGWPEKKEKFKKCSAENQKKITKELSELPEILTKIGGLKVYCSDKSVHENNTASSAPKEKIVVLYESAFSGDLKRYLAHELSHVLYDRLSDNELKSLNKVSLWDDEKKVFKEKRTKFSEVDGANDVDEDFANNVEHYLFERESFKKDYPEIHKWIDDFWGDKK